MASDTQQALCENQLLRAPRTQELCKTQQPAADVCHVNRGTLFQVHDPNNSTQLQCPQPPRRTRQYYLQWLELVTHVCRMFSFLLVKVSAGVWRETCTLGSSGPGPITFWLLDISEPGFLQLQTEDKPHFPVA